MSYKSLKKNKKGVKESSLAEHADKFKSLSDNVPHLMWMEDDNGSVIYYNKHWYDYVGVSKGNAIQLKKIVHPEDYKKLKSWRKCKKNGKTIELNYRLKRKDGSYRWFLCRIVAMKNKNGKIIQWIGTSTDIHDHKLIELDSHDNERRLKLIMDNVKDYAIFMVNLSGNITSWDAGAENILGYEAEEIMGRNFSIMFTEEDIKKREPQKEIKRAYFEGRANIERQCVRKDGSLFWAAEIITAIRNRNGRVIGYTKVIRDVNDRKIAFDALHESEERFRMLVEEIRDYAMVMLDVHGRMTTWNKGVEHIFGYKAEDVIGKSFHCFYTRQYVESGASDQELKKALVDGRSEREGWRVRKDKSMLWANEVVNAVRNKQGKLQGFVIIIKDMTETKRNEEMLKRYTRDLETTQKKLERENAEDEALLESIGEGVVATNEEGRVMLINKQAEIMFGEEGKESVGKLFHELWTTYDENNEKVPNNKCPIQLVLKTGKKIADSTYYYNPNGKKKFPAASTTAPVILGGKVAGTITVFRDIRKEKDVDKAKSEFVSLASHQLRTPLTAIKLFVEMLVSGGIGKMSSDQVDVLKSIEQSNEKMIHLVDTLLNVSHIEIGKMRVKYSSTDLNEFVKNCVNESSHLAESKKIKIVFKPLKNELPIIDTDQNLMRQVMNNLINNAIEYSPKRSRVFVEVDKIDGKDYVVSVKDNGIGIPKESRGRVFERFYRAPNAAKAKTEGTGLGLYMCKLVMDTLGGKIWIKSAEGKGSTFYVSLRGENKITENQKGEDVPSKLPSLNVWGN